MPTIKLVEKFISMLHKISVFNVMAASSYVQSIAKHNGVAVIAYVHILDVPCLSLLGTNYSLWDLSWFLSINFGKFWDNTLK